MFERREFLGLAASATLIPTMASSQIYGLPATGLSGGLEQLADEAKLPGITVAVAEHGKTLEVWTRGWASLPFSVPVAPNTLFHIGSVGKHVTAAAVLQLADAGSVDINAPVGRYLKYLPTNWLSRSIASLLSHTSGIPSYTAFFPDWDRPQLRTEILEKASDKPLYFEPGEAWDYSNTNFLLLGWLIEEISGQSYPDYLRERLFAPAGMPTARADAAQEVVARRAEPYLGEKDHFVHAPRMESGVSAAADGGVLFSGLDLAPWYQALFGGRLISQASSQAMTTPTILSSGRATGYGFGMDVLRTRGETFLRHTGSVPGFSSLFCALPSRGLSVLVMTNTNRPDTRAFDALALRALEHFAPDTTYTTLVPQNAGSAEARVVRAYLERGQDELPPTHILAPEMLIVAEQVGPAALPRVRHPVESLERVESWEVVGGQMVRYRVTVDGQASFRVIGFTGDGRIFW